MTVNGADDGLYALVHGAPSTDRSIEYVSTVQAVCAPGCLSQGMEVGMEIAQLAEEITGTPTLFCASMSGAYGSVGWITGFERIQTMEAGEQALMSDSRWLDLIDRKAGSTYTAAPEVTRQMRWRRIG